MLQVFTHQKTASLNTIAAANKIISVIFSFPQQEKVKLTIHLAFLKCDYFLTATLWLIHLKSLKKINMN